MPVPIPTKPGCGWKLNSDISQVAAVTSVAAAFLYRTELRMNTDSVLLIIGNGMATNRLLETLDTHHHFASILVLSDEPARHYNRIMLSPLLAGETDLA